LEAALQAASGSTNAAALPSLGTATDVPPSTPKAKSPVPRADNASPAGQRLSQLQTDLAASQKSRAEITTALKTATTELSQVQLRAQTETREKSEALRRATLAERRLKDREEEIRVKAKLIQDVQDEHVSLELQLNIALQKAKKLGDENKELVDRWMRKMGQEADELNERSKFS
jgi:hypothetical protein